jgi:hypothetical protein
MRAGVVIGALGTLLMLSGCGQNKREAVAECRMKAAQVYPDWNLDDEHSGKAGDFTFFCMESKGFVSDDPPDCPKGAGGADEVWPACYRKAWPWE